MTRPGRGSWVAAIVIVVLSGYAWSAEPAAAAGGVYETVIAPMFRARCVECHGEQKQKAKLALHTWDALTRGSDAGAVLVPGKPAESTLIERMKLPVDDEEHMPPQEKPQPSAEEIALLARWIEKGASRTIDVAGLQLPDALARATAELPGKLAALERTLARAEPMWEFDAAAVTKLRAPLAAKVAELQRRFPGALNYESRTSPDLHFTAAGFGRDFGDAELEQLAPLREHLVLVDVSGSGVTDAAAATLGSFSKLRVLRAGFTAVGDATAAEVAKLPALELLALPDTKVTAASIAPLTKIKTLRTLRVAGTGAEQAAQAANLPVAASAADLIPPADLEPAKR